MKIAMRWGKDPVLEGDHLRLYNSLEDVNYRRLRDAEVLGTACRNAGTSVLLEIGTSLGHSTALMARNAPEGLVHTVNIPPEGISEGGRNVTHALSRNEIGSYYREEGLKNIRQILANTATWVPDCGTINVVFIDGCHDADFVFNDTKKVLPFCKPGSLILWHDFHPLLARTYPWIAEVCSGIERLYASRLLRGRVLHLQDSWTGLYEVPEI